MEDFTGVDGTMSLNDAQRMQGGGPPGPSETPGGIVSVSQEFLRNSEPKNIYVYVGDGDPQTEGGTFVKARKNSLDEWTFDVVRTTPHLGGHHIEVGEVSMPVYYTGDWSNRIVRDVARLPNSPIEAARNNIMLDVVAEYGEIRLSHRGLHDGPYENILDRFNVLPRQIYKTPTSYS